MSPEERKEMTLTCKFCGCELVASSGKKYAFPQYRAADGHVTQGPVAWGEPSSAWCHNRAGAHTYHHPDAPEYNGGIDYSDGRSRCDPIPA